MRYSATRFADRQKSDTGNRYSNTSLPPGAYLGMAQAELGEFNLVEIDGGHETVITNPEGWVKGLMQAIS